MPTNATPAVMSAIVDNPPEALKPRYVGTVQFPRGISRADANEEIRLIRAIKSLTRMKTSA
jgi:hypothetical protein